MAKLDTIVGLEMRSLGLLHTTGIQTVEQLLRAGRTHKDRISLATQSGIRLKHIDAWVMRADLSRINGVGDDYADLLQRIGVNTVPDLALQNPATLREQMHTLNKSKRLVRRIPSISRIERWVAEAKHLPTRVDF